MTDQQKVREAFEAWLLDRHVVTNPARYPGSGIYVVEWIDSMWEGWQAALAHAGSASAEECSVDAKDAITLMRFIFRHFGDVSMSHHLTDEVVAAVRRIEAIADGRGDENG